MLNHTRYLVVCQNERQAKIIFNRIAVYWKDECHNSRGVRGRLYADYKTNVVCDSLTTVVVISERKVFEFARGRSYSSYHLVDGLRVGRSLDRRYEELKEKEKQNDHIES
jgi:hypothetical protein